MPMVKSKNKDKSISNKKNKKVINNNSGKKITGKVNKVTDKLKNKLKDLKNNPKKEIKSFFKYLEKALSENRLFVFFVIINTLNGALLRAFTMGNETIFNLDAILADMSFTIVVGSFAYLFNEKGKFIYLEIVTILLSALCVLNSAYYTFYTSFSSISLLSTARFITDVGDAVVENVLQPKDLIYVIMPL
jgi:hypothetical protein